MIKLNIPDMTKFALYFSFMCHFMIMIFFSTVEELIKDQLEAAKPELIADDIVS